MNTDVVQLAEPEAAPVLEPMPPAPLPSRRKRRLRGTFASTLQSVLITVVIAVFVITFLVQAFQIPSESMENTLLIGDYLLVDKVHYAQEDLLHGLLPYEEVHRGDIIVFKFPVHPAQHFVKRVIGVPGDRVRIRNKQVYVNGKPAFEDYAVYVPGSQDRFRDNFPSRAANTQIEADWWAQMRTLTADNGELIVPEGHYFVLGDNRDRSFDSRYWGFVPRENIVGKPMVIYLSVRSPEWAGSSPSVSARLLRFAYTLTHLFQNARWERTFRPIR